MKTKKKYRITFVSNYDKKKHQQRCKNDSLPSDMHSSHNCVKTVNTKTAKTTPQYYMIEPLNAQCANLCNYLQCQNTCQTIRPHNTA